MAIKPGKRKLIDTGSDRRYVKRNKDGTFKESVDAGRSLATDQRTRLFFLLVITISLSLLLMSHLTSANSQQKQAETKTDQSKQADNTTNEDSHWLVGSHYNTQNAITTTLLLNNKGIQPLEVRPTLYNMAGQSLELPPVIVEASSHRFINLSEWASMGGESFQQGSIKLFHYGKDLVLGAQIYLVDEKHSLSFEEKLTEIGKFDSRRLEGVWAMPSRNTDVKFALSNTTDAKLPITARLSRSPHITSDAQTFDLQPHETRLLDLQRDFVDGDQAARSEAVALSLEHAGTPEALLARAFISEAERGYSNLAQFSNPTLGKSKAYQGTGLRFGTVAGERLMPVVVVKNTSNKTATLTGHVPYTREDGTTGRVTLPPTRLKQNALRLLDMRQVVRRSEREAIQIAGLEIDYDSPAGSVIVAAHSESGSGNQVFRVPMWDVLAQRSPTGGYPWHIEETSTTKAYIKNATDREQDYVAFVLYENGGRYMMGIKPLAPHQTIEIDVKALRDNQVADEAGATIPLYVSSGQLQWTLRRRDEPARNDDQLDRLALIGRSEQIDETNGISSNYACQNCCGGTFVNGRIEPGEAEFEAEAVVQYEAWEEGETCYGYQYPYRYYPTNWSSTNNAVASVGPNTGIATMHGVGASEIKASWSVERSFETDPCGEGGYFASTKDNTMVLESKEEPPTVINLAPDCGSCFTFNVTTRPQANVSVKPRVRIPSMTAVPKGTGRNVQIEISPAETQITLTLVTREGTGQARFANGTNTMTLYNAQIVTIEGVTESSTKDNIRLEAKWTAQNRVLKQEDFCVLWVTLALRTSDGVSLDNAARPNYNSAFGRTNLGTFFGGEKWRTGVEIVGMVHPSNFQSSITIRRSGQRADFLNRTQEGGVVTLPEGTETSDLQFRDDDPQSGNSGGKVYDLDAPGFVAGETRQPSDIIRKRWQFEQWATFTEGSQTFVVSTSNLQWYSRISVVVMPNGSSQLCEPANQSCQDVVAGDNVAAVGSSPLTWN